MEFYDCPMGYCQCSHNTTAERHTCFHYYSYAHADLLCNCDRKGNIPCSGVIRKSNAFSVGILCGECKDEGKGVSALLDRCVSCSNTAGLLILALSL